MSYFFFSHRSLNTLFLIVIHIIIIFVKRDGYKMSVSFFILRMVSSADFATFE